LSMRRRPPCSTVLPYTTLFRSSASIPKKHRNRIRNIFFFPLIISHSTKLVEMSHPSCPKCGASTDGTVKSCSSCGAVSISCILRSEEHTSELQSRENLVCRLLL